MKLHGDDPLDVRPRDFTPRERMILRAALLYQLRYFERLASRAKDGDAIARQLLNAAEVRELLRKLER